MNTHEMKLAEVSKFNYFFPDKAVIFIYFFQKS